MAVIKLSYLLAGTYNRVMKIQDYADLFKALSEPVRLRILNLLLERGELCVCDLVDTLSVSQSVVSRHLAYLRNNSLVSTRREGIWVYYQIATEQAFTEQLLALFAQSTGTTPEFVQDLATLAEPTSCC